MQLKGSENRALELEQERQYALDSVSRLEDNIRRRDLGAATEMQEFREQMDRLKQEHAAALEAALQDGTRKRLEIDAQTTTLFELQTEVERLKGQTRELQQESADKEVHILQITKQRAQDKQDLEGLNIALDSKQQELELVGLSVRIFLSSLIILLPSSSDVWESGALQGTLRPSPASLHIHTNVANPRSRLRLECRDRLRSHLNLASTSPGSVNRLRRAPLK